MIETQTAGGVVQNPQGHVLVVNQHGNSWSLPKGHIDEGEDQLSAAKREIYEEAGIKNLHFIKALGSYWRYRIGKDGGEDQSEKKTIHMFHFLTDEIKLSPLDPDNPEARWVEKEKVADLLTAEKDRQFFLSILTEIE